MTLESARDLTGTYGQQHSDTWQPWKYAHRVLVAKKVAKLKKTLTTSKKATKRSKITKFIASQKSRQEFEPVIGELINRAQVDPLHLKNNVCALAHRHLLYIAISLSELPNSVNFNQVPSNSVLFNYVETLRSKCSLSRLAKKVIRWFTETKGDSKE